MHEVIGIRDRADKYTIYTTDEVNFTEFSINTNKWDIKISGGGISLPYTVVCCKRIWQGALPMNIYNKFAIALYRNTPGKLCVVRYIKYWMRQDVSISCLKYDIQHMFWNYEWKLKMGLTQNLVFK